MSFQPESVSPAEVILWLSEVSAQLHEENGDREKLTAERHELVQLARRMGLLKPRSPTNDNAT
jgi:hypothetical protein